MSEHESVRRHLHDAIQQTHDMDEDSQVIEGAVLTGWVTIAEWLAPDGRRWLTTVHGSGSAGEPAMQWQVKGWLHETLFDNWNGDE